jgi:hypothetical protein
VGHGLCDLLDVLGLASNSDSSDTWQIDEGEIGAGVGEYIQNDGDINDALVAAAHFVCQEVDLVSHLREIGKLLPWDLLENGPGLYHSLLMIQSQLKRPSGHNTLYLSTKFKINF